MSKGAVVKDHNNLEIKSLYISYDGVLEPLGQSQILPYLRRLSKRGIKFILIAYDKKFYSENKQKEKLFSELAEDGIKWINLRYHKKPPVLSTIFDVIRGLIVCIIVAKRERINTVHARSYVPSVIALVLKKIVKIKFIFDMRGFWADERIEGRLWKRKGALYHFAKFLERQFLKEADAIIVLTERAKEIVEDWGYDVNKVSIIPCCTDTDHFKFNREYYIEWRKKNNLTGKFIFVHTGSLEYWYMKGKMLDYFRVAKEVMPEVHFLILTHSDKKGILKLILDKGLDKEDFTILSVPFNEMPQYLSMVDAGIIFITPVFSKLASSPTKFAEYLSCALPVVINERIGDLEDYVVKNNIGIVVRDSNDKHFDDNQYRQTFKGLLNLIKDENLKFRCRQTACNNFSLNIGVDKYYQIYSRLR